VKECEQNLKVTEMNNDCHHTDFHKHILYESDPSPVLKVFYTITHAVNRCSIFYTVSYYRLVERFLLDGYKPQQLSTYALSLFRYQTKVEEESIIVGMPVLSMGIEQNSNIVVYRWASAPLHLQLIIKCCSLLHPRPLPLVAVGISAVVLFKHLLFPYPPPPPPPRYKFSSTLYPQKLLMYNSS
jgi:hypothetical protein